MLRFCSGIIGDNETIGLCFVIADQEKLSSVSIMTGGLDRMPAVKTSLRLGISEPATVGVEGILGMAAPITKSKNSFSSSEILFDSVTID
jgi:hypothetical protein